MVPANRTTKSFSGHAVPGFVELGVDPVGHDHQFALGHALAHQGLAEAFADHRNHGCFAVDEALNPGKGFDECGAGDDPVVHGDVRINVLHVKQERCAEQHAQGPARHALEQGRGNHKNEIKFSSAQAQLEPAQHGGKHERGVAEDFAHGGFGGVRVQPRAQHIRGPVFFAGEQFAAVLGRNHHVRVVGHAAQHGHVVAVSSLILHDLVYDARIGPDVRGKRDRDKKQLHGKKHPEQVLKPRAAARHCNRDIITAIRGKQECVRRRVSAGADVFEKEIVPLSNSTGREWACGLRLGGRRAKETGRGPRRGRGARAWAQGPGRYAG